MPARKTKPKPFNVCIVGQSGRLQYEALLFVASLRLSSPDFMGRVFVAEPQPGALWPKDPRMKIEIKDRLAELDAEIVPFESRHFGATYPNGNKIEMLRALPKGEPFVFFDSDTIITGDLQSVPFNFKKPSASLKREGTWPKVELYGPGYSEKFQEAQAAAASDVAFVPFILEGVALEPGMMQADGIHPPAAAQPRMLDNVWGALAPLVGAGATGAAAGTAASE